MATSQELLKIIENKRKLLRMAEMETEMAIEHFKVLDMEKQKRLFEQQIEELHSCKMKVQEQKIAEGEEDEEVFKWGLQLKRELNNYEEIVEKLDGLLKEKELADRNKRMENEKREEDLRMQKRYNEEKLIEEMKFQMRKKLEQETKDTDKTEDDKLIRMDLATNGKLPKLVITKFKGTHLDRARSRNQFEAEIDTANIPQITKFSYLKEMLHPNVRSSIGSLPLSNEGYERAKNTLKSKYGKSSEVINAHVQEIMGLPVVNGTNPEIIHEFYYKLVTHVQALETIGKLNMINGYVRTVLDRLPGLKSDIVRNDDNWQEWEFPQLVSALEIWTQRNPISTNEIKIGIEHHGQEKLLNNKQHQKKCAYCEDTNHNSSYCKKVESIAERNKILMEKKLCFNCTGKQHRASD